MKPKNFFTLRKRVKLTKLFYKDPSSSFKDPLNLLNFLIWLLQQKQTNSKRWLLPLLDAPLTAASTCEKGRYAKISNSV